MSICSRYAIVPSPNSWKAAFEFLNSEIGTALRTAEPRREISPTATVPIVVSHQEFVQPKIVDAHWGLVAGWMQRPRPQMRSYNAAVEDAASKPKWRMAWHRQRCLIPASYWYQWHKLRGTPTRFAISNDADEGLMFAGLWSYWLNSELEPIRPTCAILTGPAATSIKHLQKRMPLVLHQDSWAEWLDPEIREHRTVVRILKRNTVQGFDAVPAPRALSVD